MKLSIIIIGDEILLGQVADTNSRTIARAMGARGWEVESVATVGDSAAGIREAIGRALGSDVDLVITTGGLGPTKDDITKNVMLEFFGGKLVWDRSVEENVERVFARRGLQLNELTRTQALVPDSCRVVQNRFGTAPLMVFGRDGKMLVAMPGVPFETEGMLPEIVEMTTRHFSPDEFHCHHTMMVAGYTESALAEYLAPFEENLAAGLHLAYLPTPGLIRLRLDGRGSDCEILEKVFEENLDRLKSLLGSNLIFDGDATAAEILLEKLRRRGYTFASAESCTGGNIAHAVTTVAGCSDVYVGSVVSYSNSVKTGLLGVSPEVLENDGAVSEPVVRAMVEGVRRATGADCAVATSGIAGPGGGSESKPVGTVWIAAATPEGVEARLFRLPGNRARVIDRATTEALLMLAALVKS